MTNTQQSQTHKMTQQEYDRLLRQRRELSNALQSQAEESQAEFSTVDARDASKQIALNENELLAARLWETELMLQNAEIVAEANGQKMIVVGSHVTIKFLDGTDETATYVVCGVIGDPINGQIACECALGQALMGKKQGDTATVSADPQYEVLIVQIK